MVVPNILFPIPCHLQSLNRSETIFDEDLREPIQSESFSPTVIIQCQPMWINQAKLNESAYGPTEQSDGYVVFKNYDLIARNIDLKREDRIIKIGTIDCDLYIVSLQPIAHWPDIGGHGLIKAFFRDKQKSRNSPGV